MDKAVTLWILTTILLKGALGHWSVTLPTSPICAVVGSTVVLPCAFDYPEDSSSQLSVLAEHEASRKEGRTHKVLSKMWCLQSSRCITQSYVFHSAGVFPDPAYHNRVTYLGQPGTKNCSLQISGVRTSDGGAYVFYVITSHTTQKMPPQTGVRLLVVDSPDAVTASATPCGAVLQGQSVQLACCSPAAGPAARYHWFAVRGAANSTADREHAGQVWTMNEAQADVASGTYFCQVHTAEGSRNSTNVTIDVQYPPYNTEVKVVPAVGLKDGVVLTCSSEANPPIHTFTWHQGAACLTTADRMTEALATPIGMEQTVVINTTTGESGLYCCVATNDLGSHTQSLKIDTKARDRWLTVGTTTITILVVVGIIVVALRWREKASSRSQSYALTETTIPMS
ncbi:hypothetical protein NHX12_002068 [Muraenolepis orangiensis]|uniref:Ig-like domain-containing protein n=1 Tax=Muraenolepis orangiensis TaxID=630683 RepID=A0A9Q0E1Y0_9TELE|nr:hypothetical protein NHX12_002068 [Muraenolepis orangiensis]